MTAKQSAIKDIKNDNDLNHHLFLSKKAEQELLEFLNTEENERPDEDYSN